MKVVLDTNVFISGIHWSGSSKKILNAWFNHKFILISSFTIIKELRRILVDFKKDWPDDKINQLQELIFQEAEVVIPTKQFFAVKEDPCDNKFIEAAIEGNAKYIVSQDKHLLKLQTYQDIKILNPEEFLSFLKQE